MGNKPIFLLGGGENDAIMTDGTFIAICVLYLTYNKASPREKLTNLLTTNTYQHTYINKDSLKIYFMFYYTDMGNGTGRIERFGAGSKKVGNHWFIAPQVF